MPVFFDKIKKNIPKPIVIIVEGPDDAFFLDAILQEIGADSNRVGIWISDGKARIPAVVSLLLKSREYTGGDIEQYAVICDADDSANETRQELLVAFAKLKEPLPEEGEIAERYDRRKVGLYLFPGGGRPGDLETLCLETIGSNVVFELVEALVDNPAIVNRDHLRKRQAQAFLAVASNPLCAGAGWAMSRGVFSPASPALEGLRSFLHRLLA